MPAEEKTLESAAKAIARVANEDLEDFDHEQFWIDIGHNGREHWRKYARAALKGYK